MFEEFIEAFRIGKAESVLKKFLIAIDNGTKYKMDMVETAIKVCERSILTPDEIIDRPDLPNTAVTQEEWAILSKDEVKFKGNKDRIEALINKRCASLLESPTKSVKKMKPK